MPLELGSTIVNGEQIVFVEDALYFPEAYRIETGIDTPPLIGKKVVSIDGVEPLAFFRQWGREALGWNPNDSVNFNKIIADGRFSLRFDSNRFVLPPHEHTFVFEGLSGSQTTVTLPFMFVSDRKVIEKLNEDPSRPGDLELSLRGPRKFNLPANTEAFTEICLAERDPETLEFPDLTGTLPPVDPPSTAPSQLEWIKRRMLVTASDDDHSIWVRKKLQNSFSKQQSDVPRDFFEVPAEELGELEPLFPPNDLIETYQLGDNGKDATVIKINGFGLPGFDSDTRQGRTDLWFYSRPESTIAAATRYACENSDRLILDFRSSPGGVVTNISWFLHHLFPVENFYQGNILHTTQRADFDGPEANNLLFAGHAYDLAIDLAIAEFLDGQSPPFNPLMANRLTLGQGTRFVPARELFVTDPLQSEQVLKGLIEPRLLPFFTLRYDSRDPLESYLEFPWYLVQPVFVERNGVEEILATPSTSLSSLAPYLFTLQFGEARTLEFFGELPNDPYFQPIQCPGKFRDETLVVLVNGINGSASYITPVSMLDKAVVIGQGGYVGEPLILGSRRGGPITGLTDLIDLYRFFNEYIHEPVELITSTGEEIVLTNPVTGDMLSPDALLDRYYPNLGFEFDLVEPQIPDRAMDLVIEFFEGTSFDEELNLSLGLAGAVTNPNQEAEIRLNLWSNSLATDGFIYRKAIEAADGTALQSLAKAAPRTLATKWVEGFSLDLQESWQAGWMLDRGLE